jgi:hypothetical protein
MSPIVDEGAAPVQLTNHRDIISKIENLERHFATSTAAPDTTSGAHHVTFGSSTGHDIAANKDLSDHDSILHGSTPGLVHRPLDDFHHAVLGTAAFE